MAFAAFIGSNYTRRGVSKAVMVYDELRGAIVGLQLKPGIRIDKNEVCARLQVALLPSPLPL